MRKSNEVLISSTRPAICDVGADIYSLTLSDFFLRFGLCFVRCASISSTPSIYWPHIRLIVSVGNQFSFWLCHFITSTHSQLRVVASAVPVVTNGCSDCFQQFEKILCENVFEAYKIHFNISLTLSLYLSLGPFESIWFVPQKQCVWECVVVCLRLRDMLRSQVVSMESLWLDARLWTQTFDYSNSYPRMLLLILIGLLSHFTI